MGRRSHYPGLDQLTREYVEKAVTEGEETINAVEELAIARAAAQDSVQMWSKTRQASTDFETRQLANSIVTGAMETVADIALKAARIKGALTPATIITVIQPMIQRVVAIVYAELQALPDFADRIHRRINDDLRLDISTPSIASVGLVVEQIDDTVPMVGDNVIEVVSGSGV